MKSRNVLLTVLAVVAGIAIWQLSSKWHLISGTALRTVYEDFFPDKTDSGAAASAGEDSEDALSAGSETEEETGPPVAEPVPVIDSGSKGEMFPFQPGLALLDNTVALPEKKVPLVYFTYCADSTDTFTSASTVFGEFLKFQIRAQKSTATLVNVVPNRNLLTIFKKAYDPYPEKYSYQDYLRDAQDLGSDILIHPVYDGSSTAPTVTVSMVDLATSRTEKWSSSDAGVSSVNAIIVQAADAALRFAGYNEKEIAAAGAAEGAPSNATFMWYASSHPDEYTYENMLARIAEDPECVYTYGTEKGSTTPVQLYDVGLQRFPDDVRLLCGKAIALADAGSTAACVRFTSELMRRYPDNVFVYFSLPHRLTTIFPMSSPPKHTPPVYKAMVDQLGLISDRYSTTRFLPWDYAYGLKNLANYIRGGRTVDRIPEHVWSERRGYINRSYQVMKKVADARPDVPAIVKAMMHYDTEVGASGIREQRDYIKRMATLDPRDPGVEIAVASSHSIGYGNQRNYFTVIDAALKAHEGDPEAIRDIVVALGGELGRQIGWKEMTQHEAYTGNNPYVNRYLEGAKFVYSRGKNLGLTLDWLYYSIMEARGDHEKIDEWRQSGQNSYLCYVVASEAHSAGDFEKCLKYARLGLPYADERDKEHMLRYFEIKSLWKLKRYEESLKAARAGILAFPGEQTFPYMYAIVGLEHGNDLETAFDCAWLAIDYGTSNAGCNETFEKLRAKLNKPQHPALAALNK